MTEAINTQVERGEAWISDHLQQQMGIEERKAEMLASAGSFGLMFGLSTMVGATKDKLLKKAEDVAEKVKFYFTYTKHNPRTGQTYTGRSSGTGDMNNPLDVQRALERRDVNHHKNREGFERAKIDRLSPNPHAIRGREQINMDLHGGAQSTGGTSGNTINGIRTKNPKRDIYMEAGRTLSQ